MPLVYTATASAILEDQLILRLEFLTQLFSLVRSHTHVDKQCTLVHTRVCLAQLRDRATQRTHQMQAMQAALPRA